MPYNTIGANKIAYLVVKSFLSDYLTINDLEAITSYYQRKGIKIYIEGKVIPAQRTILNTEQQLAIQEMVHISKQLKDNEYAGYLYTNQPVDGYDHYEAFIVGKDKIIKPVKWNADVIKMLDPNRYLSGEKTATTDLSSFCSEISVPQAGGQLCGTLCIAYLKNLLRDDAKQITEYTLSFPYYSRSRDKIHYFFIPSPDVLRYSQSELYNKIIEAMLNPEAGNFTHKDKTYSITSLADHLKKIIIPGPTSGNTAIIEEAELILSQLPAFTEKWLERYQVIKTKRQQMQVDEHNTYLNYTFQRMKHIVSMVKQENCNPGTSLLRELEVQLSKQPPAGEMALFLKQAIPPIKFNDSKEIGYFLNKLGEQCCEEILATIPTLMLKSTLAFIDLCHFLTPPQTKNLIDFIKKPENFKNIVLSLQDLEMRHIMDWLTLLRIPTDQTADFLRNQCQREALKSIIENDLLSGNLACRINNFSNQQAFLSFLSEYIEMPWIIKLLPTLFQNKNLHRIRCLFETNEAFQDFLTTYLEKQFIRKTLLTTQNSSEINRMIECYISLFEQNASTILFETIGKDVLLHSLSLDPSWILILLEEYCSPDEINLFLRTHRDLLIKKILEVESVYPLCSKDKLKTAIHPNIDFFCPADRPDLIGLYQEKFKLLLQAEPSAKDPNSYNFNIRKNFLTKIVTLIAEEQRWTFLERIFNPSDIEKIITIEKIVKIMPSKEIEEPLKPSKPAINNIATLVGSRGLFIANRTEPSQNQSEPTDLPTKGQ